MSHNAKGWLMLLCLCSLTAELIAALPTKVLIPPLVDEDKLSTLDGPTLATMSLADPMLRVAYAQRFLREFEDDVPTWATATRADLLRRGNEATPLLLSLFEENPEQEFRANLMSRIDKYPTID